MGFHSIVPHSFLFFLYTYSVDTIKAAATCLKQVFSTQSGRQFYEDYKSKNIDDLLHYLHPFKPNKKRVCHFHFNFVFGQNFNFRRLVSEYRDHLEFARKKIKQTYFFEIIIVHRDSYVKTQLTRDNLLFT